MKLLFIRHGDPDYTIDSLTEKGWKEAEFLSEKIAALDVRDFYVSPLGRAKGYRILHTEEKRKNSYRMQVAERIRRKDQKTGSSWGKKIIPWDWLPRTGRRSKISTALTAGGIMTSCEREK